MAVIIIIIIMITVVGSSDSRKRDIIQEIFIQEEISVISN